MLTCGWYSLLISGRALSHHHGSRRRRRGMGNTIFEPSDCRRRRSQGTDHPQPTLFPPFARDALERLLEEVLRGRRCQSSVRSPGGGNGRRCRVPAKPVSSERLRVSPNEWIHQYTPDLIKGDLGSLHENVRDYYTTKVCFRDLEWMAGPCNCILGSTRPAIF